MVATLPSLMFTVLPLILSVRFSSRHSLLQFIIISSVPSELAFSPLFIAALTATARFANGQTLCFAFSPLFIAALTATQCHKLLAEGNTDFQSAFHRGTHCYTSFVEHLNTRKKLSVRFSSRHSLLLLGLQNLHLEVLTFSPLFIAALTATLFLLK